MFEIEDELGSGFVYVTVFARQVFDESIESIRIVVRFLLIITVCILVEYKITTVE